MNEINYLVAEKDARRGIGCQIENPGIARKVEGRLVWNGQRQVVNIELVGTGIPYLECANLSEILGQFESDCVLFVPSHCRSSRIFERHPFDLAL